MHGHAHWGNSTNLRPDTGCTARHLRRSTAASMSAARSAALVSTAGGRRAMRATLRPKLRSATPLTSLNRNVILDRHEQQLGHEILWDMAARERSNRLTQCDETQEGSSMAYWRHLRASPRVASLRWRADATRHSLIDRILLEIRHVGALHCGWVLPLHGRQLRTSQHAQSGQGVRTSSRVCLQAPVRRPRHSLS